MTYWGAISGFFFVGGARFLRMRRKLAAAMAQSMQSEKQVCLSRALVRRPLRSSDYVAPTAYRKLLLEVAYKLHEWDVDELRFFVKDVVPRKVTAESLTALGLLECLERHKLLGPGNYTSLRKYLKDMGREDLAALLAPPEELESAPVSKVSSSTQSSYLALALHRFTKTCTWPFSSFRRNVLEVFRGLRKEEVEQIRWLSKDFFQAKETPCFEEEISGITLLHMMEENSLVGPGNYSFLVECLEEIGRPDLILLILPPQLPYIPPSLDIPALLNQKRIESIQVKKTQYQFGMRHLVAVREVASQIIIKKAGGWYMRMLGVLSPKSIEKHSCYILENLSTTLTNMSLYLNSLLDATLELECNGDTEKFVKHLAECDEHLDVLQNLMKEIGWDDLPRKRENLSTSRQYHPIRQASYGAFSGVAEYLLEFCGSKEQFQEEVRHLSCVLTHLESTLRLAGYFWSLTSWLIALLQVAVRSPVCLNQYEGLFRILVVRNKKIIKSNSGMLEAVLNQTPVGRKLLESFRKQKLINDTLPSANEDSPYAVLLHTSVIPAPVFVFILLLLSEYPSLAADDLEVIVASLKDHISEQEAAFCQVNEVVTMTVLHGIFRKIEAFRQSKIQELHSDHGIEDIFSI